MPSAPKYVKGEWHYYKLRFLNCVSPVILPQRLEDTKKEDLEGKDVSAGMTQIADVH